MREALFAVIGLVPALACGGSADTAPDASDPSACGDPPRGPAAGLFADVTRTAGIETVAFTVEPLKGNGIAVADIDSDGDLDFAATTRQNGTALYRNTGGLAFDDATAEWGLDPAMNASGAAFADLDNDGDPELVIATETGSRLFRNDGAEGFVEIDEAFGPGEATQGLTFGDFDGDGLLDLFTSNYDRNSDARTTGRLYRNTGALGLSDVTADAGAMNAGLTWTASTFDVDRDGALDLYLANDALVDDFDNAEQRPANRPGDALFMNSGADPAGVPMLVESSNELGLSMPHSSMGGLVADFDRDGALDLYVTNVGRNKLYLAQPGGGFEDRAETLGVAATRRRSAFCPPESLDQRCLLVSWGAALADFDLDGRDELLVLNGGLDRPAGQPAVMFRGAAGEPFEEIDPELGCIAGRALIPADLDGDGDLDLLVTLHDGPIMLFENHAAPNGHWLRVALRGRSSNRDGIGSVVTAVLSSGDRVVRPIGAGGVVHSWAPTEAHFGGADAIESLSIVWPTSEVQTVAPVSRDRLLTVEQP